MGCAYVCVCMSVRVSVCVSLAGPSSTPPDLKYEFGKFKAAQAAKARCVSCHKHEQLIQIRAWITHH